MITTHLKHNFFHRLRMKETWAIFFIMGIIMLDYPFMDIFNKNLKILGFPLLYLYITTGWAISILVIFVFTKSINLTVNANKDDDMDNP